MHGDRTHTHEGGGSERPRRVLFVDDEPDIVDLMDIYLEQMLPGVEVVTAESGEEAIETFRKGVFDLVVSDFRMPRMDGVEFLSLVQKERPEVPRLLYTAYGDPVLARRARDQAGVREVLSKDLSPKELVANLARILAEPRPVGRPH